MQIAKNCCKSVMNRVDLKSSFCTVERQITRSSNIYHSPSTQKIEADISLSFTASLVQVVSLETLLKQNNKNYTSKEKSQHEQLPLELFCKAMYSKWPGCVCVCVGKLKGILPPNLLSFLAF